MNAADTNIVVRYLTGDHPEQFAKARALIDDADIFVCTTLLLETGWVLGRAYRFSCDRIISALTAFAGLPRVTLEDPALAAKALDWMARGMDFADAREAVAAGTVFTTHTPVPAGNDVFAPHMVEHYFARYFDQLKIEVADDRFDETHVRAVARSVQEKVQRAID